MAAYRKKMKLLLLGKNGQLGTELEKQARAKGLDITALGREELDITDNTAVCETIKKLQPTVILNASAYHVVPDCEQYPQNAFAINTIALKNLAEIAEEQKAVLVHYSTDYIFDGIKGKPYKEDDKPNPLQVYGISKLAGEFAVLNYCSKAIIIRACYVYGGKTGSRAKKGNFVLTILKQIEGKTELEVASEQIVSPTYAEDLAEASLKLIQKKESKGIYHLVNEGHCTLSEFAQQIVKYKKQKTKIIPVNRGGVAGKLHRPLFSALQNTRAKQEGIKLPHWKASLKKYVELL
jgi:dTDP-4-dehydrorhamnose reductase